MKLYFLCTGTSQGIPVIGSKDPVCLSTNLKDKRLRVSVWIKTQESSIVIDCGPDFRQQMLRSGCEQIDAFLLTHEHADHTAGLDDIRPYFFKQGALPFYAHQRVLDNLSLRFDYIFSDENKYPGSPSIEKHTILKNTPFKINNTLVEPIDALHGNLQVFGFKINKVVYLTDVKTMEEDQIEKIKNCSVLIVNCLHEREHHSHFNLDEMLAFVEKVNPQISYLTHISFTFGFHDEIEAKLPKNIKVAYDNLEITID